MKQRSTRLWVISIAAVFVLCAVCTALLYAPRPVEPAPPEPADPAASDPADPAASSEPEEPAVIGPVAVITLDGKTVAEIDLGAVTVGYTLRYTGRSGITNVVEVETGQIRVQEAECPDQICVYQGWSDGGSFLPIVCLPNALIIEVNAP